MTGCSWESWGSRISKLSQAYDGEGILVRREEAELGLGDSVRLTASEPLGPHLQNGIMRTWQRIARTESGLAEHPAQRRFSKMFVIRLCSPVGPAAQKSNKMLCEK